MEQNTPSILDRRVWKNFRQPEWHALFRNEERATQTVQPANVVSTACATRWLCSPRRRSILLRCAHGARHPIETPKQGCFVYRNPHPPAVKSTKTACLFRTKSTLRIKHSLPTWSRASSLPPHSGGTTDPQEYKLAPSRKHRASRELVRESRVPVLATFTGGAKSPHSDVDGWEQPSLPLCMTEQITGIEEVGRIEEVF
jgi:hypothetical protein